MRFWESVFADWRNYGDAFKQEKSCLRFYIKHAGAKISFYYRLLCYTKSKKLRILSFIVRLCYHHICMKYACEIPSRVVIGEGVCFPHPFGIVINSNISIGKNATILSGVVLGKTEKGIPLIEDDVYIGANACVIGAVTVGKGAVIGAGSVVTKEVLPHQVVAGNPAHVLKSVEKMS